MLHFQAEPERHHPLRDRRQLTEPRLYLLVHGDPLLMLGDLFPGQPGHVARIAQLVEEQLQLGDVAHLEMLVGGGCQPLPQRAPARLGKAVGLAPPAAVLGLDVQQPHPFEPLGLRVQLRVLTWTADRYPHHRGVGGAAPMTYREWDARTNRLARALAGLGVRPRDRVAFLLAGGEPMASLHLAVQKLGAAQVYLAGRIAQFGRALAGDVSRRLFEQFAAAVEEAVASGQAPQASAPPPGAFRLLADAVAGWLRTLLRRKRPH